MLSVAYRKLRRVYKEDSGTETHGNITRITSNAVAMVALPLLFVAKFLFQDYNLFKAGAQNLLSEGCGSVRNCLRSQLHLPHKDIATSSMGNSTQPL